jgi:hypothetical protein
MVKRWEIMQKIFVSYSRKDTDFVRKLAGDLEKAGYDVWWDLTDLRGGEDWIRRIPAAIEESQFVIVVLSPSSVISEWVEKEYTQALSLRKKIIPIMLTPINVPFALNTINYLNFAIGIYEDNFKNLLSALGFTGKPPTVTPFRRAQTPLPIWMRYAIPAFIGIVILLALLLFRPKPETPLPTPTSVPTSTATATLKPFTATPSATETPSFTATPTTSPTLTPTKPTTVPSPTKTPFETLSFCVLSVKDFPAINVRSGPATYYPTVGEGLRVGRCLAFSAIIINERGETWLLVANNQNDPDMLQYEGGWIRRDLLIPEDLTGPINLPLVTLTPTPTITLTPTPSFTPTKTPSPTATDTPTPTPTDTPTSTPTFTPSSTPTETDTPTS